MLYCKPRVLNSFPPHCPQLLRWEDEKASGWQETLESPRSTVRRMEATLGALHDILQNGDKNCCFLYFLNNFYLWVLSFFGFCPLSWVGSSLPVSSTTVVLVFLQSSSLAHISLPISGLGQELNVPPEVHR